MYLAITISYAYINLFFCLVDVAQAAKEIPKEGPNLYRLFGRRVANDINYTSYSLAAQYKDIVWTEDTLSLFLKAPRKFIPGTKMLFPGIRHRQDRKGTYIFQVFVVIILYGQYCM